MRPIVVLGAGSWGTALAIQFARGGGPTVLWGRAEDEPEKIARERENVRYLPGAKFPQALAIEPDLGRALAAGDDVVLVVPSSALRAVLTEIRPRLGRKARVAWASKGFELSTGKLPHQVAREVLGPEVPIAVLSGPTFAKEVGQGLPTAIAVASPDEAFARELNPNSLEVLQDCKLEPAAIADQAPEAVQFERLGYFCRDPTSTPGRVVFNRTVGLRDTWAKLQMGGR